MKHALCIALVLSLSSDPASARRRSYHHEHRHGFTCGIAMRAITGGRYGPEFNLARHWLSLPRTSAHPGAVVVQARFGRALGGGPGGHVSRIESIIGPCRAVVRDNRGSYQRDICKNLLGYVNP